MKFKFLLNFGIRPFRKNILNMLLLLHLSVVLPVNQLCTVSCQDTRNGTLQCIFLSPTFNCYIYVTLCLSPVWHSVSGFSLRIM
jgi:hypothetical protein